MINNTSSAVFFDFDGTLADTVHGLYHEVHTLLQEYQRPITSLNHFRKHIDKGTVEFLKASFQIKNKNPQLKLLHKKFRERYYNSMTDNTELFPGIEDLLKYLNNNKLTWGIITNRTKELSMPLFKKLKLAQQAQCMVFADTLPRKKPNPDQMLYACDLLKLNPENCIYVGDTENDMRAANAANMKTILCHYGYMREQSDLSRCCIDYSVNDPAELFNLLKGMALR